MTTCLIGIDCATEPKKRGVWHADHVSTGLKDLEIADLVIQYKNQHGNVLIALDAPLGWPSDLGESLTEHYAGQLLNRPANHLFDAQPTPLSRKNSVNSLLMLVRTASLGLLTPH